MNHYSCCGFDLLGLAGVREKLWRKQLEEEAPVSFCRLS